MLLAALLAVSACAVSAPEVTSVNELPAKVLFVGNSFTYYNNSLHNHYSALVKASGITTAIPSRARSLTISGGHLSDHAGGFERMVASDDWDAVVMQGNSLGPISADTSAAFVAAARQFSAVARKRGARPVFFMTWAYDDRPEMTAKLDAAYSAIGQELNAQVVPVGLSFAKVTSERPDIALRTADAKHPTVAGTYLAACTFFAAFYRRSPVDLDYMADLEVETARYLQAAAWTAVTDYQKREKK